MESLSSNYQTKLLTAMATNPKFLQENRYLLSDDLFSDPIERLVAEYLLQYYDQYREISPKDISETFLFDVVGTPEEKVLLEEKLNEVYTKHVEGLSYLSDKVREHTGKIRITNLITRIFDDIEDEDVELDDVIRQIHQTTLQFSKTKSTVMDLNDIDSFDKWADFRLNKDRYRLPTGYPLLDKRIDGGLGKGDVVLFIVGAKGGWVSAPNNSNVISVLGKFNEG